MWEHDWEYDGEVRTDAPIASRALTRTLLSVRQAFDVGARRRWHNVRQSPLVLPIVLSTRTCPAPAADKRGFPAPRPPASSGALVSFFPIAQLLN